MVKIIRLYFVAALFVAVSGAFASQRPAIYNSDTDSLVTITSALTNTNTIAVGISEYFKPAFGVLRITASPFLVATNIVVTNGTISAGDVSSTRTNDQVYLVVDESGVFEVVYEFQNGAQAVPSLFEYIGRYEGNPSHHIQFSAQNQTNGVWDNFPDAASVLEYSTEDSAIQLTIPTPQSTYISNGLVRVKALHIGSAVGSHQFLTDFAQIIFATAVLTNAGTWYPFMGATVSASNNISINGANATITTVDAGSYKTEWYCAFTGRTNTTFEIENRTNGVATTASSIRTIGEASSIGSMSAFFMAQNLGASVTNSWYIRANKNNAWFSLVNGAAMMTKEAN